MSLDLRKTGIIAAAAALVACSPDIDPTPVETVEVEAPIEERSGSVLAEFEGGDTTEVHAQFLNLRGISTDQALHALSVWSPDRELNIETCSLRSYDVGTSSTVEIEMLDVGTIEVAHLENSIRLEGRSLPDLVSGVSGVVYGTEESFDSEATELSYVPGTTYRITAPGDDLSGFEAQLQAPDVPTIALVAGQTVDSIQTVSTEELDIEWTTPSVDVDADLYLEIRASSGSEVLRCHLEDDGLFTVPAGVVTQLAEGSDALEISMRRAQLADLSIQGMDRAEVIFAATDRVDIEVIDSQN